jgi:putative DNA methylase
MNSKVVPFSLKDAPSLIEVALPVQKISIESYKEQMAVHGKTLTALGSYWKGRKPLILNKACIIGSLLPTSGDTAKDIEIFELLMGMDDESMKKRLLLHNENLPDLSYLEMIKRALRPEEINDLHDHIWDKVNQHLKTDAHNFPELIEQLGIMRFGHRPKVADPFSGSGQIPFEAARLGCNVYAADLSPVACMLTWGALNVVGGSTKTRKLLSTAQEELFRRVQTEVDELQIESDGSGWRAKVYLYCLEVTCPETGWKVPLLPTLIISKGYKVIAKLNPDSKNKRYDVEIINHATEEMMVAALKGTVRSDSRGGDSYLYHVLNGTEHRVKIQTIRGDFKGDDRNNHNQLRLWEKSDFKPRESDIYQERLYCVQWMKKVTKKKYAYQFRSVTEADIEREKIVDNFISAHLAEWQEKGWVPDMKIESGYNTDQPIRERGWQYWHHLFNPRQLLLNGLINKYSTSAGLKYSMTQASNFNSKLSRWNLVGGGGGIVIDTFYNQALNTLYNYGCRGLQYLKSPAMVNYKSFPIKEDLIKHVESVSAENFLQNVDLFITDPPYGDAVKYEEILEFFIAWLRKNPPPEFADWIWDSRRSLAIKGEDDDFKQGMISSFRNFANHMPDNGIQIIMFTHKSGEIWADMADIVWASGLKVTAAWTVATETESAIRDGNHVKGTVLLVCRKRTIDSSITTDDLGFIIKKEVTKHVEELNGLSEKYEGTHHNENLFSDADLQLAAYAAALKTLTAYSIVDGKDMMVEAGRPKTKGKKTKVQELIEFAVQVATTCLLPSGITSQHWEKLNNYERYYLKMLSLEASGQNKLDTYLQFAKAYRLSDWQDILINTRANQAILKKSVDMKVNDTFSDKADYKSPLKAVLIGIKELREGKDGEGVLHLLPFYADNYFSTDQRELLITLSRFIETNTAQLHEDESRNARILSELIINQHV